MGSKLSSIEKKNKKQSPFDVDFFESKKQNL